MSLYCGRNILPSEFLAVGYVGGPRSSAISALFALARPDFRPAVRLGKPLVCAPEPPPGSLLPRVIDGLPFLRILAILGNPKSSSSSSSYVISLSMSSSSSSSSSPVFQSSCVWDRKSLYVRRAGGGDKPTANLAGGGDLALRLLVIGGVLGLGLLETEALHAQISQRDLSSQYMMLTGKQTLKYSHENRMHQQSH